MPKIDTHTVSTLLRFQFKSRVESHCVNDVDYDPESQDMTIVFQQRGTYVYHDVPLHVYVDFQTAGSQGQYFNLYIRESYSYERIS